MIDHGKETFFSIYRSPEISSRVTLKVLSKNNWGGHVQIVLSTLFFMLNGLRYSVVELIAVIPTSANGFSDSKSIGEVELSTFA